MFVNEGDAYASVDMHSISRVLYLRFLDLFDAVLSPVQNLSFYSCSSMSYVFSRCALTNRNECQLLIGLVSLAKL